MASAMNGAYERQCRTDQEPTVTSKSSGLEYLKAFQEPAQEKRVFNREDATKNDKGA